MNKRFLKWGLSVGLTALVSLGSLSHLQAATQLVSGTSGDVDGTSDSYMPTGPSNQLRRPVSVISADGKYVAFESNATNLVPGVTYTFNNTSYRNIFIKNLETNAIELVTHDIAFSAAGDGDAFDPVFCGNKIAYRSGARNLTLGLLSTSNTVTNIFVYDLLTKQNKLISVSAGSNDGGNNSSFNPVFDLACTQILFESDANNFGFANDTSQSSRDVFSTTIASPQNKQWVTEPKIMGLHGNGGNAVFDPAGTKIFFDYDGSDLVANTGGNSQIYMAIAGNPATPTLMSHKQGDSMTGANAGSRRPIVCPGGELVFESLATDLEVIMNDQGGTFDLYLANAAQPTNDVKLLSKGSDGRGSDQTNASGLNPVCLSTIGVAFQSEGTKTVLNDTNGFPDIFRVTFMAPNPTAVSDVSSIATEKGGKRPAVNGTGVLPSTYLVYETHSPESIVLYRITDGSKQTISLDTANALAQNAVLPAISQAGSLIVYQSSDDNIVPNIFTSGKNVFAANLAGVFEFVDNPATYSKDENPASTVAIPVKRTGGKMGSVTVQCKIVVADTTATEGAMNDFTVKTGEVTFADNDDANKNCEIDILDDAVVDSLDLETVKIQLAIKAPANGAKLGANKTATIEISENNNDDQDGDGVANQDDNCPMDANSGQQNNDADMQGDACDVDDDNDGVLDANDACPFQFAMTANGCPDADQDGVNDNLDVCPNDLANTCVNSFPNPDDVDGDLIPNATDNCPTVFNPLQTNSDNTNDGGDACDADDDNDGISDVTDSCPTQSGPAAAKGCPDADLDNVPDYLDLCPNDATNTCQNSGPNDNYDGDIKVNSQDNCPTVFNSVQFNTDNANDGGDACDPDDDNDGVLDGVDICPLAFDPLQLNTDGDAAGDACDTDDDGDLILDQFDTCPLKKAPGAVNGCPEGELNILECSNGIDDDSDAAMDCNDPDCINDPAANCPAPVNDMDADGVLDAQDSCPMNPQTGNNTNGCPAESICNDTLDNDTIMGVGDAKVDCDDADCAGAPNCKDTDGDGVKDDTDKCIFDAQNANGATTNTNGCPAEILCNDSADNDKDNTADCTDDDCANASACQAAENCTNNADDNNNGLIDCNDPLCDNIAAECTDTDNDGFNNLVDSCVSTAASNGSANGCPEICNLANLNDEDADLASNCDDADCVADPVCAAFLEDCTNGLDDNGNQAVDCADSQCATNVACIEAGNCGDGIDNDVNGFVDCNDNACAADLVACPPPVENCTNGSDDDGDQFIDCGDPDCSAAQNCQPLPPENCSNGIDDDQNSFTDCDDNACAQAANCQPPVVPEACNDNIDNDTDGATDCADSDCSAAQNCQPIPPPPVEICNDGIDNDKDGRFDCFDPDCENETICQQVIVKPELPNSPDLPGHLPPFADPGPSGAGSSCSLSSQANAANLGGWVAFMMPVVLAASARLRKKKNSR